MQLCGRDREGLCIPLVGWYEFVSKSVPYDPPHMVAVSPIHLERSRSVSAEASKSRGLLIKKKTLLIELGLHKGAVNTHYFALINFGDRTGTGAASPVGLWVQCWGVSQPPHLRRWSLKSRETKILPSPTKSATSRGFLTRFLTTNNTFWTSWDTLGLLLAQQSLEAQSCPEKQTKTYKI